MKNLVETRNNRAPNQALIARGFCFGCFKCEGKGVLMRLGVRF